MISQLRAHTHTHTRDESCCSVSEDSPHSCFLSTACVEKAAGHHRAPPAEAGSVCHVQQQQVVLHSSSPPIFPSFRQVSSTRVQHRGDLACSTLITMATPPQRPSIMSSSDSPAHPHPPAILSRSPQESYATAAEYNNQRST